jgi:hypothetical protein
MHETRVVQDQDPRATRSARIVEAAIRQKTPTYPPIARAPARSSRDDSVPTALKTSVRIAKDAPVIAVTISSGIAALWPADQASAEARVARVRRPITPFGSSVPLAAMDAIKAATPATMRRPADAPAQLDIEYPRDCQCDLLKQKSSDMRKVVIQSLLVKISVRLLCNRGEFPDLGRLEGAQSGTPKFMKRSKALPRPGCHGARRDAGILGTAARRIGAAARHETHRTEPSRTPHACLRDLTHCDSGDEPFPRRSSLAAMAS